MSSLRSSVRPKSSKQPWGTILEPEFGMGHQKMTSYEVDQTVSRLYYVPEQRHRIYYRSQQKPMSRVDIDAMVCHQLYQIILNYQPHYLINLYYRLTISLLRLIISLSITTYVLAIATYFAIAWWTNILSVMQSQFNSHFINFYE